MAKLPDAPDTEVDVRTVRRRTTVKTTEPSDAADSPAPSEHTPLPADAEALDATPPTSVRDALVRQTAARRSVASRPRPTRPTTKPPVVRVMWARSTAAGVTLRCADVDLITLSGVASETGGLRVAIDDDVYRVDVHTGDSAAMLTRRLERRMRASYVVDVSRCEAGYALFFKAPKHRC